jgi:GNAT superfamily N-acetyltransferase
MARPEGVRVRAARPLDLETVVEILTEASEWQRARGLVNPWPLPIPEAPYRNSLERGELFVAEDLAGRVIATMILQWDDRPIWGERPPDAGYVHKLAVRRDHAGRDLGGALLEWAAARTRERARRWLRLDTLANRPRLHRYYEEHGFHRVGEAMRGDLPLALFERDLDPARPERVKRG